ncbi:MAG: hypothetical protein AB7L09_03125 [Nitrospira sp.]
MSRTRNRLEKGKYAYSSHSLLISGDIVDVFTGVWRDIDGKRALIRCDGDIVGGEPMCVIKLRRPMTLAEYGQVHHPALRPMVKHADADISAVLMPAGMACTIPDYMEAE